MRKLIITALRNTESTLFGKYLLLTNTVSSGLLMWAGEVAAQRLDKSNKTGPNGETKYDREKIKQLTVVGISQGPLHHYTYLWMERLLPGTAKKMVFNKILSDQVELHDRKLELHHFWSPWPLISCFSSSWVPSSSYTTSTPPSSWLESRWARPTTYWGRSSGRCTWRIGSSGRRPSSSTSFLCLSSTEFYTSTWSQCSTTYSCVMSKTNMSLEATKDAKGL